MFFKTLFLMTLYKTNMIYERVHRERSRSDVRKTMSIKHCFVETSVFICNVLTKTMTINILIFLKHCF